MVISMKRLKDVTKKLYIALFSMTLLLSFSAFFGAGVVSADTKGQINQGINEANGGSPNVTPEKAINSTITNIINVTSALVGVIAVIMIIIAGLRYVTSAGNPEAAKSAKNTILYAIVGLVIVALAQIIVHFVLHQTSG